MRLAIQTRPTLLATAAVLAAGTLAAAGPAAALDVRAGGTSTPHSGGYVRLTVPDLSDPGKPPVQLRWDPCTPIRYSINLAGAPPGVLPVVRHAVAATAAATGITFTYLGTTRVRVGSVGGVLDRAAVQRAGSDLVVEWDNERRPDSLLRLAGGEPDGTGLVLSYGSYTRDPDGTLRRDPTRIRAAAVAFSADRSKNLVGGTKQRAGVGLYELLLHELGHTVGLEHSADPTQIMFPQLHSRGPVGYAAGDLRGLAAVGRGAGCLGPVTISAPPAG